MRTADDGRLGCRRGDAPGQARLDALRMAFAVFDEGVPLRDYHTVQTIPNPRVRRPDSRPVALRATGRDVNTTITLRDYRVGPLYGVAVWNEAGGGPRLVDLAEALRRPVFTLYFGRKSCPLAAPPGPRIFPAEGPLEALARTRIPSFRWRSTWIDGPCLLRPPLRFVASDTDLGGSRVEQRNDVSIDRTRWHFGLRNVHIWTPVGEDGR